MELLYNTLRKVIRYNNDAFLYKSYKKSTVKKFIINLNTQNQLRKGKNANDDVLGFYSSFTYSSEKQGMAGRLATFGVVDLYLSGRFYKTFNIIAENKGFTIEANTELYDEKDFEEIYGNVVGLSETSIDILQEYLLEIIIDNFKKKVLQ